jgi:hypothetical protein
MMRAWMLLLMLIVPGVVAQEKPAVSGPQVGEKLPALPMKGVFDADAGKDLDVVTSAAGKPVVLVFVHVADRPSIGLTRTLLNYTATRAKDGVHGALVWLADDASDAEAALKRMRHGLPKDVPVGIAAGGREGPGSYGLNRNVSLTVLIAKDNKVTANFALVQPSMQADLPRILDALVAVAGGKAPKLEDLPEMKAAMAKGRPATDEKLTGMLRAMIQKTATPEQVDKKAQEIDEYIKTNEAARKEIARISTTLVNGGKLADYGTLRAQEKLKAWAKEFAPPAPDTKKP